MKTEYLNRIPNPEYLTGANVPKSSTSAQENGEMATNYQLKKPIKYSAYCNNSSVKKKHQVYS